MWFCFVCILVNKTPKILTNVYYCPAAGGVVVDSNTIIPVLYVTCNKRKQTKVPNTIIWRNKSKIYYNTSGYYILLFFRYLCAICYVSCHYPQKLLFNTLYATTTATTTCSFLKRSRVLLHTGRLVGVVYMDDPFKTICPPF